MRKLQLSSSDKVVFGVIGGLCKYFEIPSVPTRLGFLVCVVLGIGTPVFLYALTWILMLIFCGREE